jgi:hypothetical protein
MNKTKYTEVKLSKLLGRDIYVRWIDSGIHAWRTDDRDLVLGVFVTLGRLAAVHNGLVEIACEYLYDKPDDKSDQNRMGIKISNIEDIKIATWRSI